MKKATVKTHSRSVKGKGNSTVKKHTRAVKKSGTKGADYTFAPAPVGGVKKENLAMRKRDDMPSRSKVGPQMVMKGNPVPKTAKKGGEGKSKKARGV